LNMHLIRGIMRFLDVDRRLVMASSLDVSGKRNELLVAQCNAVGAETYLSGAGGRAYLDTKLFADAGISVVFQDFKYPVYSQLYGDFVSDLSVVDYLFCTGGRGWEPN